MVQDKKYIPGPIFAKAVLAIKILAAFAVLLYAAQLLVFLKIARQYFGGISMQLLPVILIAMARIAASAAVFFLRVKTSTAQKLLCAVLLAPFTLDLGLRLFMINFQDLSGEGGALVISILSLLLALSMLGLLIYIFIKHLRSTSGKQNNI